MSPEPSDRVVLLPMPPGSGFLPEHQRYLRQAVEDELKRLIQHVRGHTLTLDVAALGLGRITGYYDLLAMMSRQQAREIEQHP